MALKDEATRQARQLEGTKKRLDLLEANQSYIIGKLDEITSKLETLTHDESAKCKVVYESIERFPWNIYVYGAKLKKCYARMSEEEYRKFCDKYSNCIVTVDIIEDATDKLIDKLQLYVTNAQEGRRIFVQNIYLTPESFVRFEVSSDHTKKIFKDENLEYALSKTVSYKTVKSEDDYCTEDENYEFIDGTRLNESRTVKLEPSDIEYFYKEYGYDKWLKDIVMPHKEAIEKYDDGEHLDELREKDPWAEDTEESDNKYVRLANLIAWFDIDKIARNIVRINNTTNEDKITSANTIGTNFTSVRNGLYDDVKECVESFIKWTKTNELDESHNIFEQQIGRIHFIAIFNSIGNKPDEKWISYKLYWTDEEADEGGE